MHLKQVLRWLPVLILVAVAGTAQTASPKRTADAPPGWFAFEPKDDAFTSDSRFDLRFLNEKFAGEHGFITVKDGEFAHSATGEPLRFWGVNGPPQELKGADLRRCARVLAKYGVNLVRIHGGYFNERGEVDPEKIRHAFEIVEAMKAEGIYSYFSVYFPLWLTPKPDYPALQGYDGTKHPFAALFFDPNFQAQYRQWWTALLTSTNPATGKALVEEAAVAGLEMQNEDSFFFWTFSEQNIPGPELQRLEKMFGDWLAKKYGSLSAALQRWNGLKVPRDRVAEGRAGFRPLWNVFSEKTPRDQDTAAFLLETQTRFYGETRAFLRHLGFKGLLTPSNWYTASPEVLGPLEKLSYTGGDFVDRHGYFGCNLKGDNAEWSVRDGQTYADRSALRFDPEPPGGPRQFVHPAMDPHYDGKPSMLSETTWNRPNRFRSEAPLYFAAYGALQHSDAIVHFAFDGARWSVKPGYFMQPWTLMTPAMLGQFPAAALIYRQGLVSTGSTAVTVNLSKQSLLRLEGTPFPQDAALDELRLKDLPAGATAATARERLDPLLAYVGRVNVNFVNGPGSVTLGEVNSCIDHAAQTVKSSTGELKLDYGKGVLCLDASRAQGVSGRLSTAASFQTTQLAISSEMDLGHIIVVSLDAKPLAVSDRMLLQVMTEEQSTGFETEEQGKGIKRIVHIGRDPWLVKEVRGSVRFKRKDAAELKVTALDFNGYPETPAGSAENIQLRPRTLYYVIAR